MEMLDSDHYRAASPCVDDEKSTSLVSICVATYNRQHFLDEFLGRIAAFERLNYELVISDNASDDRTPQVVHKWQPHLRSLYYFRQDRTLTAPENVCAACNAARGDYIFNISDDDMPIEDGLLAAKRTLDGDPSCAAAYGSWFICDDNFETVFHCIGYGPEPTRVQSDQLLEMYYRYWTVELPMFRRAIYQRHTMGYSPELPLDFHAAARFISYGNLAFIPDLVAKIRSHAGQESRELYGSRLLDAYQTDYELFLSEVPGLKTPEVVAAFLHKSIKTYLIAVGRALGHGKFLEAHRMMKKALAYRIAGVRQMAIAFEKAHGPKVLAEYMFELCRLNRQIKRVVLEHSIQTEDLKPLIEKRLGDIVALRLVTKDELLRLPPDEAELVITRDLETMERRLTIPGANPAKHRCLDDIVDVCSVF